MTLDRKFILNLLIIGLLALLMRLFVGEVLKPISHRGGMTQTYFDYASNLLDHHTYSRFRNADPQPDSLRMPLYSVFLACVKQLSGPQQWENWVSGIQYLMGAAICVFVAIIGMQVANPIVGIIAGLIAAFYTDYYYISLAFIRETFSLFLFLLFLVFHLEFIKTEKTKWGTLAAFFGGIGILSRPETALTGLLLVSFNFRIYKGFIRHHLRMFFVMVFLAFGPWTVWVARNAVVHHHFQPFSSDGAWGFFMGQVYHPDEAYTVADPKAIEIIETTPIEMDWVAEMNRQAFQAITQHPIRNLSWAWIKIRQTFMEYSHPDFMSLLYPLLWFFILAESFKNGPNKYSGIVLGVCAAALHLSLGFWDHERPVSLLQVRFSDIVLPGALGFSAMILKSKTAEWKTLAASFLTLIVCVALYIAHLRARLVLVDWILMIGAAYAFEQAIQWMRIKIQLLLKRNPI